MRTFRLTAGLALLSILVLQGCSTNPTAAGADSIQEFSQGLHGKKFEFLMHDLIAKPSTSARVVTEERIPEGLLVALSPARVLCVRDGGETSLSHPMWASGVKLPQRIACQRNTVPLWALLIEYADLRSWGTPSTLGVPMSMTIYTQLWSAEQYAAALQEEQAKEQAREKAAAAQRERQAAFERDRPKRIAQAQQAALERSARVAAFQANLKAGDRIRWVRPRSILEPEGMVVRVEGPVVLVQFDISRMAPDQRTMYVPKTELEPIN